MFRQEEESLQVTTVSVLNKIETTNYVQSQD